MDKVKEICLWWFFSVSIMTTGIMYLVNYEPSTIILSVFVAPFSIITYLVFNSFRNEMREDEE